MNGATSVNLVDSSGRLGFLSSLWEGSGAYRLHLPVM